MTYQVTARLSDNNFHVVGPDHTADLAEAMRVFERYANLGHTVRLHEIHAGTSRLIKEA